ncbi:hypothetical protein ACFL1X_06315 [Candidatus Hydrogenedentota bacterium]
MADEMTWTKEAWDESVSAIAYNPDWWDSPQFGLDTRDGKPLWRELKTIYEEEMGLAEVASWAKEIIERMMELPLCGYYAFPQNILQICSAIANEKCPEMVMNCYTVDPDRKILMSYYVFCLDAWLKNAPLETAQAELGMRESLGKDWSVILSNVYAALGERTELKLLVVKRLIHRLRWWVKSLIWFDDRRDRFMLDVYSGDIKGDGDELSYYGNPPYGDPYFVELRLNEVKELEEKIVSAVPNGKELLTRIQSTWLCAPKAFRYVEKLIAEIGAVGSQGSSCSDTCILQCEDTYPDLKACAEWFEGFVANLDRWLDGDTEAVSQLGEPTPVKHWLAQILRHKLLFSAEHKGKFGKLVGTRPSGRSGRGKTVESI